MSETIRVTVEVDVNELARELDIDPSAPDEQLGLKMALGDDDFLEQLVRLRLTKGFTQQQVADKMQRDKSAVSRFEYLGSDPTLSMIRRYARAIGVVVTHHATDPEVGCAVSAEIEGPSDE